MTGLYIALGVIAVLAVFVVSQYNGLIRLNNVVNEAFAQIEVQLRRRSDLIPNLVETVKGYASHEKEALEKVVQARAAATSAQGVPEVAAARPTLTLKRLRTSSLSKRNSRLLKIRWLLRGSTTTTACAL